MPAIKSFIGESSGNINYDRRYSLISIVNYGIISVSSPFRITHFFNIKRPCPLITGVLLLHENKIHCVLIYMIFIMFRAA